MNFTLNRIKGLIAETVETYDKVCTDDAYLESKHDDIIGIVGHVTPYYSFFWTLAQKYKLKFVVELGSWRAVGAAFFAASSPDTTVVTIDIHREDRVAHEIVKEIAAHYDNLHFIHGWTWDVVDQVAAFGFPIDVLFMDAWCEYQYMMREWKLYEPLLNKRSALVIVDDVFDAEPTAMDMVKFWNEIRKGHEGFIDTDLHLGIPMGFMKYRV